MSGDAPSALSGYPYVELPFDKRARPVDDDAAARLRRLQSDEDVTDLLVLAHGWNNDIAEARDLYRRVASSLRAMQVGPDRRLVAGRRIALAGVLWPSKRFAEAELLPGGAASLGADPEAELAHRLRELRDAFDAEDAPLRLEEAERQIPLLEDSRQARTRFLELLQSVVPDDAADDEDASRVLLGIHDEEAADALFRQLDDPTLDDPSSLPVAADAFGSGGAAVLDDVGPVPAAGAAAGGGAGGRVRSARQLLNFVTYYQMKSRAGRVGAEGLAPVLRQAAAPAVRVHLAGHSFGGRLVTAAAAEGRGGRRWGSLVLLQAAFSHYGFAEQWKPGTDGAFRHVLTRGRLAGPLVVTHTRNDTAVGVAYALASRIAGQVGAEIGGPESRFGGLGANGAQLTPEAVQGELLPAGRAGYAFRPGTVYNLRADAFITDHGAVSGPEVGHLILAAVATQPPR